MKPLLLGIGNLDARLFFLFYRAIESRLLLRFFLFFTWTANGPLFPLLAVALFLTGSPHATQFLGVAAIGFAIELPLYWLVKNLVKRDRPYKALEGVRKLINPPDQFSFPSGHTAASFLVAVSISAFFPAYTILAFAWAALVGLSRVYLAVHFPTDVLAGAVLGAGSALVGLSVIG